MRACCNLRWIFITGIIKPAFRDIDKRVGIVVLQLPGDVTADVEDLLPGLSIEFWISEDWSMFVYYLIKSC